MSVEQAVLAAIGTLVLLLFILPAVMLAFAARVNYHVRRDLPGSPRLASALRWNFWTGCLASWGGPIRLALANSQGMDSLSQFLRTWSRQYFGWSLGLGLLACLVPESNKPLSAVAGLLSFLPVLYFVHKLHGEAAEHHGPIADASHKTVKWLGIAVGLAIVAGVASVTGMVPVTAIAGLAAFVLAIKASIHVCRLGLIIGVEGCVEGEDLNTRAGGKDTFAVLVYLVVVLVVAVVMQAIGGNLFR